MPAQQSWLDRCSDKLGLLAGRSGSFRTKMPKIRKFWDQTFVGSWKLPPENSETLTYFFPIKGVGYIRQVPPDLDGGPKDTPMNLKAAHLPFLQPYISDVALDNSSTVIFAESHFKLNWHLTVQKSIYSGESGATALKISRAMGIDVEYTGCRNVVGCTRKGRSWLAISLGPPPNPVVHIRYPCWEKTLVPNEGSQGHGIFRREAFINNTYDILYSTVTFNMIPI